MKKIPKKKKHVKRDKECTCKSVDNTLAFGSDILDWQEWARDSGTPENQ